MLMNIVMLLLIFCYDAILEIQTRYISIQRFHPYLSHPNCQMSHRWLIHHFEVSNCFRERARV